MKKKILKVTIILSMLLLTLIPMSVNAATSGTFGNNLNWVLDSNGTLTISGTGAMPDWNGGRETPWSSFGSNDSKIKKVIISDGITSIGNSAFENFRNLETITLNDDIESIGNYAFNNCYGLKMTRVVLPYSLTSIGKYAFFGCNISIIDIPSTVTSIGTNAFAYCENLEELRADGNSYYSSLNGNLYNGNQTKLIQYVEDDTTFTIPNSVTTIGEWAFYNYNNSLTTITIPETVTKIESSAFYKCSQLKEVIYGGTKAQWDKITISDSNTPLTNATIHYTLPSTKTTFEDNQFIVTPKSVPNGSNIIFACYNGNKMVYVNPYIYAGETTIPFSTTETYDKVKVMIWENLETCVPLCEAEDVPLN
ncbi:MAG: leucine-rich repeat domain-containing protein [Clostridia bacterium]|nr:leucine-rich repeat domain-containing protein [Clostridia bacterium]